MSHTDRLRAELERGVSNVEIDWFLRGKLPTSPPPQSITHPHLHSSSPLSPSPEPPITLRPLETHSIHNANNETVGHTLSRTRSLPATSSAPMAHTPVKKKGFFKSLFGKKEKRDGVDSDSSRSASPQPQSYLSNASQSHTPDGRLMRTRSLSVASTSPLDPNLEAFLKYYRSKGLDSLKNNTQDIKAPSSSSTSSHSSGQPASSPLTDPSPSNSSITSSFSSLAIEPQKHRKFDVLGRPIPAHPAKAPLPPAIIHVERHEEDKPKEQSTSKLNFLRRHISNVPSEVSLPKPQTPVQEKSTEINPHVIPGLDDLPPLKRVAFDIPVFFNDPPQQIPSRTPRKGEVEIMKDGTIVIHKLTAAEKKQIMNNSGGGLVVGGSGPLKIIAKASEKVESEKKDSSKDSSQQQQKSQPPQQQQQTDKQQTDKQQKQDQQELQEQQQHDAQKHAIEAAAAEAAAGARAKAAPNELKRIITNNEDEVTVNDEASKIGIDKPMVRSARSAVSLVSLASEDDGLPPKNAKIPLDVIYTRCCHLREILPIPATLKQLKPGSCDPLSVLQLRNPQPSLVEVLTFSDFISVAPILCVSLDGVSLSSEMFRIILSSLAYRTKLEKLTLRNTSIDETGWKLLCWFLTKNRTLSRLDLTQVPSLTTNVQKPSKAAVKNIVRMTCDANSRSDMNWNLLSAALLSRGGIDEIVINGAKMSDPEFKNFIEMGILHTTKLGLAYNDLSDEQCKILADNLDFQKVIGLDLGYNDLSGSKLKYFIDRIRRDNISESVLKFISLNSTNLTNDNGETNEFVSGFAALRDLRFIDLSNNKKLWPGIMTSLTANLPLYPSLGRIHLDYNDLSQNVLVAFSELIPFCKYLTNISLVGNKLDNVTAGALATAMRLSKSVIALDIDYDQISPKFREEIALYTVRNMQHQVYGKQSDNSELKDLQEEISNLLRNNDPRLFKKFLERATKIRKSIHETIDELFRLRLQGELNTDGKEALIRFCFVDASIEKGLQLLQKKSPAFKIDQEHPILDKSTNEVSTLVGPTIMNGGRGGSSTNLVMSSYIQDNGHSELMPFGIDSGHDRDVIHGDAQEIKDDQRARSADNLKLKEEASALKMASMFRESNLATGLTEESMQSVQSLDTEDLKDILAKSNDLDNMVDVLDALKKKGVTISEIYKKDDHQLTINPQSAAQKPANCNAGEVLDLETLKNTKSNITRQKQASDKPQARFSEDSISDSDTASEDEDLQDINLAYDEILDHLEKVRTNNEAN